MTALTRAEKERQNAARSRAGHIRYGMQVIADTWIYIARARAEGDHLTLGYDTWEEYVDGEFGEHRVKLPPEKRAAAVAGLVAVGLTQREAGYTLGLSAATVNRALPARVSNETGISDADHDSPAETPIVGALKQAIKEAGDRAEESPAGRVSRSDRPVVADPGKATEAAAGQDPRPAAVPDPPPPWDPEERKAHEAEVQVRKDIESARSFATTFVAAVRNQCFTILAGYRLGERGLVTVEQIADCRRALDQLEAEVLADAQR